MAARGGGQAVTSQWLHQNSCPTRCWSGHEQWRGVLRRRWCRALGVMASRCESDWLAVVAVDSDEKVAAVAALWV